MSLLLLFNGGTPCFWHLAARASNTWTQADPASTGAAFVLPWMPPGAGSPWVEAPRAANTWTPAPAGQGSGLPICGGAIVVVPPPETPPEPPPETPPEPPPEPSNWILLSGSWNDAGIWIDSETWND